MGSTLKIQMNRFNGVDYDVMLPQAADNPNMIVADTAGTPIDPNPVIADKLNTPRKIGNADFDGTSNITLEQIATIDSVPTVDSNNLVISGGVATALNGKANTIHTHSYNSILEKPSSFVPSAHKNTHMSGGSDAITPTSIGAATTPAQVTVTLPVSGWTQVSGCWQQTVAVGGLLATDNQATVRIEPVGNVDAAAQLLTDEAYSAVFGLGGYVACNANGQMYCRGPSGGDKPGVNFNVNVCISR